MESPKNKLDLQCLKLIELLAELEEKKLTLEKHMQNGFLDLAKARYAIGINRVSKLHYPKNMIANSLVKCSDSSNEDRFTLIQANSTSDANDESTEEISTDNSLRKRFPSKPTESNDENKDDSIEDLKPLKDKKNSNNASKPQINNPIRWFSVLAPQSLRSAQKSFLQATQLTCDISSLQVQLEELQKTYKASLALVS